MEDKHIQIKVSRTICGACHCLCGVLVHVRNGHIIKIEGDPEHPQNEAEVCPRFFFLCVFSFVAFFYGRLPCGIL